MIDLAAAGILLGITLAGAAWMGWLAATATRPASDRRGPGPLALRWHGWRCTYCRGREGAPAIHLAAIARRGDTLR